MSNKAISRIGAEIHFVVLPSNGEGFRQLARAGTKLTRVVGASAFPHCVEAATRFQRSEQDKAIRVASLYQDVKHPVDTVVKINVSRAGLILFNESAGTRPGECVTSFVIDGQISFRLDDNPGAVLPNQLGADQFSCTRQGVALEKGGGDAVVRTWHGETVAAL